MDLVGRRKSFGRWLRACRKQARITQAELAKALAYDSSQLISNIERGVSLLPSRRLPEFARILGCSLLELEIRYFQCSARNTSESRMPDLLLKYLPLIELLEYGKGGEAEFMTAIHAIQVGATKQTSMEAPVETDDRVLDDRDIEPGLTSSDAQGA